MKKEEQEINPDNYPKLSELSKALRNNHRFVGDIVNRCYKTFGNVWANQFEQLLNSLFSSSQSVENAARGYATFSMHSMRLQAEFERVRKYREKTHEQAASEVYFNEHHMMQEYLPGLLLSHFLWPHHYRQLQFFNSAFIQSMQVAAASSFVEVGIGTGLYSCLLLQAMPQIRGIGFDISPSSKHFTENQLAVLGLADRYSAELRDITSNPLESKTDWLICIEVLEHLDDPVSFLRGLRHNMAPGAKAFITAALNAAHTDHIYLYRNGDEVLAHLTEAGFTMEQYFIGAAYKPSATGIPVPQAAAFIVN